MKKVRTISNDTVAVFDVGDEVRLRLTKGNNPQLPPGELCGVLARSEDNSCPSLHTYRLCVPAYGVELKAYGIELRFLK